MSLGLNFEMIFFMHIGIGGTRPDGPFEFILLSGCVFTRSLQGHRNNFLVIIEKIPDIMENLLDYLKLSGRHRHWQDKTTRLI